jgi:hypothetical protein
MEDYLGFGFFGIALVIFLVVAIGMYKTFSKMGYDNVWFIFIPILNIVFLLKVIDKPIWWIVLFLIPCVNSIISLVVSWMVSDKVSKSYGGGIGLALGLFFLPFIFYPYLGFAGGEPKA